VPLQPRRAVGLDDAESRCRRVQGGSGALQEHDQDALLMANACQLRSASDRRRQCPAVVCKQNEMPFVRSFPARYVRWGIVGKRLPPGANAPVHGRGCNQVAGRPEEVSEIGDAP